MFCCAVVVSGVKQFSVDLFPGVSVFPFDCDFHFFHHVTIIATRYISISIIVTL